MYKTDLLYDYNEYKKFSAVLVLDRIKKRAILLSIIFVALIIITFIFKDFSYLIGALIGVIIAIPMSLIIIKIRMKKLWKSSNYVKDKYMEITFDDEKVSSKMGESSTIVKYSDIYKILETKTHFYILVSQNQGFIVKKANCSQEMIDFIKKIA